MTNKIICFLCHPFHRGGVTQWMIDAALEYVRRGWDTWFVTIKPERFISGNESSSMWMLLRDSDKIKLIASRQNSTFELGTLKRRSIHYATQVFKNIPAGTPIILSDDESIWMAGKMVSNSYPVIGVLHSDDEVYYTLYQKYHSFLSGVVAVSKRIKQKAPNVINPKKISVIPCGIQLPVLNLKKRNDILQILWAGRIEERQKRVSDIPKIAKELKNSGTEFHWTIAGHGDEASLINKIEHLELKENFTFAGWINRDQLYQIMDRSDILILTSNFEGMPVVVMEALSKGLGIVSTKVSGLENLVHDNQAKDSIRLYGVGDVEEAVESIKEVSLVSQEKRISAARNLAERYYSIQSCIDLYNIMLDDIDESRIISPVYLSKLQIQVERTKSYVISRLRYMKYKLLNSN